VKKWETSVGPRCLSNGSTSSPRPKMERSRRERPYNRETRDRDREPARGEVKSAYDAA